MFEGQVGTVIVAPKEPMAAGLKCASIKQAFFENGFNIRRTFTQVTMALAKPSTIMVSDLNKES